MAQKDARIRFLERELAEREKEMEMKDYEQPPAVTVETATIEAGEERLRDLERKVRDLEALVKGLTEEVLDAKSVMMKLLREAEERRKKPVAEERKPAPAIQAEPRTAAQPAPARAAEPRASPRPAERQQQPADPVPPGTKLELIMQNDGTLRPEPRRPSEYIVASTRTGSIPAKARGKSGSKPSDRTLFVEQKKRMVDDVIQAEEDDTVDLDR
ncbi:hypothetical protein F8E02_00015 [Methanoculleus sp. Wushi-C6]|uniref:Uncharacterized protein n=1 Tax=Methanoculleus caldifontis TaxID=2651577 RepID=A0ABU3WX83_9EURY|nr:hypothetical protein [Methanoculleus sp. Wushi-C6]MDV2480416.1 hypothetical protein [Methanoculleus sp. Wushi-C6]